jgi:UDP-N-acetylmuramoyl-L-alanyl-D-glutamate--2,6-diaminopimelate ligase
MRIKTLIQGLGPRHHAGPLDTTLTDLSDDSRAVPAGALFISRGKPDKQKLYIQQALDRGAAAVLSEPIDFPNFPQDIPWYHHDHVDQQLAGTLAERFFGQPAKRLSLIGITGTNGKTTTSLLIQHLLQRAGIQTGVIGTIHTDDGTKTGKRPATLTTPGAIDLSRELARMANAGCRAVVAEVSSHALEQGRAAALTFRTAVFTNLTQDHLDYHATMQAYAKAKSILFTQLTPDGHAILNHDDSYAKQVLAEHTGPVWWTTLANNKENTSKTICRAGELTLRADSSSARFLGPWGDVKARLPLVGEHNVSNTLQAIAAAHSISDLSDSLHQALETIPQVPGRLEKVPYPIHANEKPATKDEPPAVLVDYAHTPDALENALSALRPVTQGRLIVMFGCGGDRDKTKRPIMAQAACRLADKIFLTSDNPRTEDPQQIIKEAAAGVPADKFADLTVIPDRADAIKASVFTGRSGDTVLLAGKGHEDYQTIGTKNIHFDDREHAAKALQQWARQKADPQ